MTGVKFDQINQEGCSWIPRFALERELALVRRNPVKVAESMQDAVWVPRKALLQMVSCTQAANATIKGRHAELRERHLQNNRPGPKVRCDLNTEQAVPGAGNIGCGVDLVQVARKMQRRIDKVNEEIRVLEKNKNTFLRKDRAAVLTLEVFAEMLPGVPFGDLDRVFKCLLRAAGRVLGLSDDIDGTWRCARRSELNSVISFDFMLPPNVRTCRPAMRILWRRIWALLRTRGLLKFLQASIGRGQLLLCEVSSPRLQDAIVFNVPERVSPGYSSLGFEIAGRSSGGWEISSRCATGWAWFFDVQPGDVLLWVNGTLVVLENGMRWEGLPDFLENVRPLRLALARMNYCAAAELDEDAAAATIQRFWRLLKSRKKTRKETSERLMVSTSESVLHI